MPTQPTDLQNLPLQQLQPNPDQARKVFDEASMAALQASLRERGLINPISVKRSGPEHFLIIAGERRYRAALALGWKEIAARIWPEETPPEEVELLSLVENLERRDLNPVEEANAYRILTLPPYSLSHQTIAERLGHSRSAITESLALLDQPTEIQELLMRRDIDPTHVKALARVTSVDARVHLATQAAQQGWSVRELTRRVAGLTAAEPKKVAPGDATESSLPRFSFTRKAGRLIVSAEVPENFGSVTLGEETSRAYSEWLESHPRPE